MLLHYGSSIQRMPKQHLCFGFELELRVQIHQAPHIDPVAFSLHAICRLDQGIVFLSHGQFGYLQETKLFSLEKLVAYLHQRTMPTLAAPIQFVRLFLQSLISLPSFHHFSTNCIPNRSSQLHLHIESPENYAIHTCKFHWLQKFALQLTHFLDLGEIHLTHQDHLVIHVVHINLLESKKHPVLHPTAYREVAYHLLISNAPSYTPMYLIGNALDRKSTRLNSSHVKIS